jgi:hypothetical protein
VVGDALSRQGFEVLPPIKDAKRSAILGGVRDLVRRLNAAGAGAIGFIYYSGHGAAEKDTNINYLIPVDASAPGTSAFWDDSVKLDDVLRLLDGARSAAKFIVFDACRNELQLPTDILPFPGAPAVVDRLVPGRLQTDGGIRPEAAPQPLAVHGQAKDPATALALHQQEEAAAVVVVALWQGVEILDPQALQGPYPVHSVDPPCK